MIAEILALIKAAELGAPLVSSALILLLVAALVGAQFRKLFRQDKAERTIDSTYAGVLKIVKDQHDDCLAECAKCHLKCEELSESWAKCEAHGRVLERRLDELQQTISEYITRLNVGGNADDFPKG